MQNCTQLSITEAGISVISRGDIYAHLHIFGSAERGITALLPGCYIWKPRCGSSVGTVLTAKISVPKTARI